jgi:hypothetical protein
MPDLYSRDAAPQGALLKALQDGFDFGEFGHKKL